MAMKQFFKVKAAKTTAELYPPAGSKAGSPSLCVQCWTHWGVDVRHCQRCEGRDLDMGKEDLKKLGTEDRKKFNHAVDLMRGSMFYTISELRALFPDHYYQVAEFLNTMGHCAVPEEIDETFSRHTQDNTHFTNRHFTVEAEIERQRNAQMKARMQGKSGNVAGEMVEVDISNNERQQLTQMAKEMCPGMSSRKLNIVVREKRPVSSTLDAGPSETEHVGYISGEDVDDAGLSETEHVGYVSGADVDDDDDDFESLNFRPLTSTSNKPNKRRIRSDEEDEDEEVSTTDRRLGKRPLKGGSKAKRSKSSQDNPQRSEPTARKALNYANDTCEVETEAVEPGDNTNDSINEGKGTREGVRPKQTNWTTGTKAKCKNSDCYNIPKDFAEHPAFVEFGTWFEMQGKKDGIKKNHMDNVLRVINGMCGQKGKQYEVSVITAANFQAWTLKMKSETGMSSQTLHNYYKSLKQFIKSEESRLDILSGGAPDGPVVRAKKQLLNELGRIELIGKRLHNDLMSEHREKRAIESMPPNPWEVTAVLRSNARADVDKYLALAEKGTMTRDKITIINRFLSCIILLGLGKRVKD